MMRTFGWVVLCLGVVFGIGLYLGWFSVSGSINKAKITEDIDTVKDKLHGGAGEKTIEGTIHQIDTARQELTLHIDQKQDVTIKVDASTTIKIGDKDSSFSDLKTDDPVSVKYEAKKEDNVARTIAVSRKS